MGAYNLNQIQEEKKRLTESDQYLSGSREKEKKRYETEEERRVRKEREREERHRTDKRSKESEQERAVRKDKERREREERRKTETEDERMIRKEKERRERDERHKNDGRRKETEEERRARKRHESEIQKMGAQRKETEEERRIRKDKEREERHQNSGRKQETEEERRIRKDKERTERHKMEGRKHETEEDRRIRKEKERRDSDTQYRSMSNENIQKSRSESEEERRIRKDRERKLKKEKEAEDLAERVQKERDLRREMDDEELENQANNSSPGQKKRKTRDSDEEYSPFEKKHKTVVKQEFKTEGEYEIENKPLKIRIKTEHNLPPKTNIKDEIKHEPSSAAVKKEEAGDKVKWWEQEKAGNTGGRRWHFLQHNGPVFAPPYETLPDHVRFYYDRQVIKLSPKAEEVAGFYARMLDHDYTTKEMFNKNFFKDWRRTMNEAEKKLIRDLSKCDFTELDAHFKRVSEQRKARSKEEKKKEKLRNEEIAKEYGACVIAYSSNEAPYEEKIGNYRIEPPGLFRGRGEHPKQGCVKLRVMPEDVTINCSKNANPPNPPKGHRWKEVRHDHTVTWLATWTENVQNQNKYVMLNPSSKMKAENDMLKYEKARRLKDKIVEIRANYTADWKSKEMATRQRAVALYFIDKLALRAGHEKGEDQADTVGCCSLRVEHLTLHDEKDGKEYIVEFDFLGKDSIRYFNSVPVEKRVFKNLKLFMENKKPGADLFDRLNTETLNDYLRTLMPDLSAKVFRTYNASITLQEQLEKLTDANDSVLLKVLSYNRSNREVAILCNHQKAVSKTFDKTMENLQAKVDVKREAVEKADKDYKAMKKQFKHGGQCTKADVDKMKSILEKAIEQLNKLETQQMDKEENKTVALGTSKLNYMDPRISVAWCKKWDIPIQKVFTTKTHREKFQWAIEMAEADYVF